MGKSIIFLSLTLAVIKAQSSYIHNSAGDKGEAYVHDTTGDFGPYHYWKLRQQAKEQERSSEEPVATKRRVISVRQLPTHSSSSSSSSSKTARDLPVQTTS